MLGKDIQYLRRHMVSYNIKTKKGFFPSELLIYVFCILVIIATLVGANILNSSAKNEAQTISTYSPISPIMKTTIISFLESEVILTEVQKNSLEISSDKVKISHLIYLNSDLSNEIVNNYRQEFIEENFPTDERDSPLNFYNNFYEKDLVRGDLINIEFDSSLIPSLDELIEDDNFMYYIQTIDDTYSIIYFKR